MSTAFIAVHGGAGSHSRSSDQQVKRALKRCGSTTMLFLSSEHAEHDDALQIIEEGISVLEDDDVFNAGYGANLTLQGTTECDAAIMDGRTGDFGSVGAVSGVKNPIRLSRAVLDHSRSADPLGRIPPLTLVSTGAHAFATSAGVQTVHPDALVAPRARSEWERWQSALFAAQTGEVDHKQNTGLSAERGIHDRQDTVGAVVIMPSGRTAAGVSSGGLLLKLPGRVGEAAVFGAGCWAQEGVHAACPVRVLAHLLLASHSGILILPGAGEYIIRCALARTICEALNTSGGQDPSDEDKGADVDVHEVLRRVLVESFWAPSQRRGDVHPNVGVLVLVRGNGDTARLWCAFTTTSMAVAYASTGEPDPKTVILRRPTTRQGARESQASVFITAIGL